MSGPTPGPWHHVAWDCNPRVNEDGNRFWGIKPIKFHSGALYLEASGWMTEENARLIAASPDMLSALKGLGDILAIAESNASGNPEWETVSRRINAARAAIAKATGAA